MASFVRALVNATHSDSTMHTEIEFASNVGPPLFLATAALTAVLVSFTYMDPVIKKTTAGADMLRIGLGLVSIYGAYDFGFGYYKVYDEKISRQVYCGISTISLYLILRAIDASFITNLLKDGPPRWVSISSNKVLPMPTTFLGRIAYSLDLLTSMRGPSWFSDRRWDFTPSTIISQQARLLPLSRWRFIRMQIIWWILFHILFDIVDTGVKLVDFNPTSMYPVSRDLPVYQQILCSIGIGLWTHVAIAAEHTLLSLIHVGLLGVTKPASWPPMFEFPFLCSSVPEFWGKRWHYIFRRVFDRLLAPFLPTPPPKLSHKEGNYHGHTTPPDNTLQKGRQSAALVRAGGAFVLTTILHLIIIHRNVPSPTHPYAAFWDPSIMQFFLAQPLGIALDGFLCSQLQASGVVGKSGVAIARRTLAVGWLLWTARWWADAWVRKGLWYKMEQFVQWSPVRGLLWGDWYAQGVYR